MNSDRIEKEILLRAPRERVWQAISVSSNFGVWFGVEFDGPFVEGVRLTGRISPTKVDPEVARLQEPARGMPFSILIERLEPVERFSFRWHPFAIDDDYDYSQEPTTRVVFELHDVSGGILLSIIESGFDQIPLERRTQAREANDQGWSHQTRLIQKYLALDQRV